VNSLSDIQSLPFLTKAIIRERIKDLKSADCPERCFIPFTTSGSTGEPLDFYTDARNRVGSACTMRGDMWAGYKLGEKNILFWVLPRSIPFKTRIKRALKEHLTERTTSMDFGDLSDEHFHKLYNDINRIKPAVIVGYAVVLNLFSVYLKEQGLKIHAPRGILAGAEMLLEDHRRRSI
jgi:phenylacetate-CoA ligase